MAISVDLMDDGVFIESEGRKGADKAARQQYSPALPVTFELREHRHMHHR